MAPSLLEENGIYVTVWESVELSGSVKYCVHIVLISSMPPSIFFNTLLVKCCFRSSIVGCSDKIFFVCRFCQLFFSTYYKFILLLLVSQHIIYELCRDLQLLDCATLRKNKTFCVEYLVLCCVLDACFGRQSHILHSCRAS